jgi:two-component system sensor histidine kinase BaeS
MSARRSLAFRIGVVTVVVALISVLVAALVSLGLVRGVAQREGRRQLAREAELVAGLAPRRAVAPRVRTLLVRSGIRLVQLDSDGTSRGRVTLPAVDAHSLLAGHDISRVETLGGQRVLVEGRALLGGGAVALVQTARLAPRDESEFFRRELLACLIGLVVAGVAGALVSRRLARPLQHAATGARRLAAGERSVRIKPEGPAEVAAVADAVNTLAGELEHSETRQRDFLLSVSHELRTPLTAITGFSEALADGVTVGDQVRPVGAVLLGESRRLERLIGDLLDLARLQAADFPLELVTVDVRGLLRESAQVWAARCATVGVIFRLDEPADPLVLSTDPTRVRQIIDGLAENALRVTPAGAPIVLATRPEPGWAVIEVRDGGPGLTPQDCADAFTGSVLYQRYRGIRQVGTGLGLAIVHRLAVRLGGGAMAGRAPEGGACFTVRLPQVGPGS